MNALNHVVRYVTVGTDDPQQFWRSIVRECDSVLQGPVTHWHYTDAIKPPPKPEPVTVRMRPGTERPRPEDYPVLAILSGLQKSFTFETADGFEMDSKQGTIVAWFPRSEAIPRERWRHGETWEGHVSTTGSGRYVSSGDGRRVDLPSERTDPVGTRIRVTVSMEEVRDGG